VACSSKLFLSCAHMDGLIWKPKGNKISSDQWNATPVSLKRSLLCFLFFYYVQFLFQFAHVDHITRLVRKINKEI
jgi:cytosine/uracil/thiamine/allantoin permease